jgi:hypothetical protein
VSAVRARDYVPAPWVAMVKKAQTVASLLKRSPRFAPTVAPDADGFLMHESQRPSHPCIEQESSTDGAAETFRVMSEPLERRSDGLVGRITATGALTELGGELAYDAVVGVLGAGCSQIVLDLAGVTSREPRGLEWLQRACLRVEGAGGHLWTIGACDGAAADRQVQQ